MTHVNDDIEELNSLKQAASERRASRTKKPVSKKRSTAKTASGTSDEVSEAPPSASEESDESLLSESEEVVPKLVDQVETIFGEIGEASRERPALALVSAFAVGILIGHIFSKR
jgi:hypothetical protein